MFKKTQPSVYLDDKGNAQFILNMKMVVYRSQDWENLVNKGYITQETETLKNGIVIAFMVPEN
jgi:hypothetical protein